LFLASLGEGVPLTSIFHHPTQQCGSIGEDSVNSHVEQPVHLWGLVNGPDVHLDALEVRKVEKSATQHRHPIHRDGNLQGKRRMGAAGESRQWKPVRGGDE